MGYNPYICVMCGEIQDNGWVDWSNGLIGQERCKIFRDRTGLEPRYTPDRDKRHTEDICHRCFRKGPSRRDPFFDVKRTKDERRAYFMH
jgi:hypothetical protein